MRIVIADGNSDFLKAIVSLLEGSFEIVATVLDVRTVLDVALDAKPDVLVLDFGAITNRMNVIKGLVKRPNGPVVVICSLETDMEVVAAAQDAGALGYVYKPKAGKDLITAINCVVEGKPFVSVF